MYERLKERFSGKITSNTFLAGYLALFLFFNFFGVSLLSPSVWAPYTCSPSGDPWSITSNCDVRGTVNPSGSVDISSSSTVRIANGKPATWLKKGPYVFYRMEENSGSTMDDDSPNAYEGSLNGPTWVSGRFGPGLDFDGSNDYVVTQFSKSSSPAYQSGLTVSAWVYRQGNGTSSNNRIVAQDCSEYWCLLDNEGNGHVPRWIVEDSDGSNVDISGSSSIPTGSWTHLAGVFDPAAQEARLYMNGNLVATSGTIDAVGSGTTRYMVIGDGSEQTSYSGSQNCCYFNGNIDEVRVYDHALSTNAIKDLAGQPGTLQVDFLTDYVQIGSNSKMLIYPQGTLFQ